MNKEYVEIGLENLANGAAVEVFGRELKEVLKNIVDPSTEAKEKRVITLTVTILPDENRETAAINIKCNSKQAGVRPLGSRLYIAGDKDPVAFQHNYKQGRMLDDQNNVIEFEEGAKE